MIRELIDHSIKLPSVRPQQSRVAAKSTIALSLIHPHARGPAEAFIDDSEFCHLHSAPRGSMHLVLPGGLREGILARGWGEMHPGGRSGVLPTTVVMIYAPRDAAELEVALKLIRLSYDFATGHTF